MGRKSGKLKVALIENQKARNLTFKRRKEGVMTKIRELSKLCDVNACLILHAPEHAAAVWPPNDPALVLRLVHQKWAKNPNSKNDDEVAQFDVRLVKKAQQIRAQIDRLKSDQQDQFASTAAMVMPYGGNRDGDGLMASEDAHQQQDQDQFGHLDNSSSVYQELMAGDDAHPYRQQDQFGTRGPLVDDRTEDDDDDDVELEQRELRMDDAQQQDQFGDFLDNSSTAMMMKMPHGSDEQLQDQDRFGHLDNSSSIYQEDSWMALMMGYDSPSSNYGNKYPQQQYESFGPVDVDHGSSPTWWLEEEEEEDLLMVRPLVIDDTELMKQRESMGCSSSSYQHSQQQQQFELFGPQESLMNPDHMMADTFCGHEETSSAAADDDTELIKQRESIGYNSSSSIHGKNYPQMQQQYQLFGPVVDLDSSSSMYQEEEDLTMMCPLVIDEVVDLGQSSSPTWQDDPFCEQTATETAAADFYDGDVGELFTQLYTPPRMMWV